MSDEIFKKILEKGIRRFIYGDSEIEVKRIKPTGILKCKEDKHIKRIKDNVEHWWQKRGKYEKP